jgi:hypothetical protein
VIDYVGAELDLFDSARNWKRYWAKTIRPYLGEEVLEVGAGIGSNVTFLRSSSALRWHCLEPDPSLYRRIVEKIEGEALPENCTAQLGTIDDVPALAQFDTVLYIDVMEHIRDDHVEFAKAALRLSSGGYLVVLSPAYQWLYSPFDAAIGHHRRYTRATLQGLGEGTPLNLKRILFLDSVGLLASSANKLLLRKSIPHIREVRFWDSVMIPLSNLLDPTLRYSIGKTVVGIWQK